MDAPAFESIQHFGVSRESFDRLLILARVLELWQSRMNLVAPSTLNHIWQRHIIDSLQLLPLLPSRTETIADLGSGGGFPGLVLAATQPALVHMFEASEKKSAFLQEALRQMNCRGIVHRGRLEAFKASKNLPKIDVVTSRAFAPLSELLSYAKPFFSEHTIGLFHKGQDIDTELTEAAKTWKISARKHSSVTDSQSVILEIKEIAHVKS